MRASAMNVLIVERDYQVRDLIERGLAGAQQPWIALGPSAMAALERRGESYATPEEFYAKAELESFLLERHRTLEELCARLDEERLAAYPDLRELNAGPFRLNLFNLIRTIDPVNSRVFALHRIFQTYRHATVYIHVGQPHSPTIGGLLFSNRETLWGRVAALPGWSPTIHTLPEPLATPWQLRDKLARRMRRMADLSPGLTTAFRCLAARDWGGIFDLLSSRRPSVLVLNAPGEWSGALPLLRESGWRAIFADDMYFAGGRRALSTDCAGAGRVRALAGRSFVYAGIDYFPILESRLRRIWNQGPTQFRTAVARYQRLAARYSIRMVLRSTGTMGLSNAINQAARAGGAQVCIWQHGFVNHGSRISQFRDLCDAMTSDTVLVYGDQVKHAYENRGRTFGARIVAVGSSSIDGVRRRSAGRTQPRPGGRVRVLYATTNYLENHNYLAFPNFFSDRLYYRDQLTLIETLRRLAAKASITIKLHPDPHYLQPPWVASLPSTFVVVRAQPSFMNLLDQSDAALIDFPSTTLLQALASGRPTFVLTRHWSFLPQTTALLKKRAIVSDQPQDLAAALTAYVHNGYYPADVNDLSYLSAFGNHLCDGQSAQRAVKVVLEPQAGGRLHTDTDAVETGTELRRVAEPR
jgi:hypothetical protein